MKIIYPVIITILCSSLCAAQPWLENLPQNRSTHDLTLFDYQAAFESYWEPFNVINGQYTLNGEKVKARGWKQFKRWEHNMKSRVDPSSGEFPRVTATEVYHDFLKKNPVARSWNDGDWKPLGPVYSFSGYSGIGRINCVAFHPSDMNTFWVGAAAGGIWVTHNNGDSWNCLTENTGVLAVSDIVIPDDYTVSNTIYIATGDRDGWDNRSIGVLKSIDGGNSWDETGLTFSIYDGQMVNRLIINPADPLSLIAATTSGVYKTIDGGINWNVQLSPIEFIDLEYKSNNSDVIFGSTKGGEIYRTLDGGTNWLPVFQDGFARRIELAVSPNQPEWIYSVVSGEGNGLYGVFKSIDGGNTFDLMLDGDTTNILNWESSGEGDGGQGWYDLAMAASPIDANILFVGGVNTWKSLDGGLTWSIANHWWGDQVQAVHADKHNLRFRNNGALYECNDGGIYLSYNNGVDWIDKTNGIQISQMYRLGVSQTDETEIITGLQDNGSKYLTGTEWHDVIGGDGMECLIDYTDPNIQYGSLYFGQFFRTNDHWATSVGIKPFDAGDGGWITPFIIDPHNPEILYAGYQDVWVSYDRGDWWEPYSFGGEWHQLQHIAKAPANDQMMYISDGHSMWVTFNAGIDWMNISEGLPFNDASIQYITVKHDDANTVWVAMSGYTAGGVYESNNSGVSWRNISDGLPTIPAYSIVQNKLITTENHLYVGTELGIFFKNGNQNWTRYNNGLPNVEIGELEIYYAADPRETKLRAATYGRGLWETPIAYSSIPVSLLELDIPICVGSSATLNLASYIGAIQWQQSEDGIIWSDVTEGNGMTTDHFITSELTITTFYRARVVEASDTIYSNTSEVIVVPIPGDAGFIAGPSAVCQGTNEVLYLIEPISFADTYVWTLPSGATGLSDLPSIVVNYDINSVSGLIQVNGRNTGCDGSPSSLPVEVFSLPEEPIIGITSQPSCTSSVGSILLENLPEDEWIVTNLNDDSTITGTNDSLFISNLLAGNYGFTVQNGSGCISSPVYITIDEHALAPPTPIITSVEPFLHSNSSMGNQWYLDDIAIAGATNQIHEATESGDYYTIVTLENCSSEKSNIINITLTGTEQYTKSKFQIYPNPVRNELIIEFPTNTTPVPFNIFNSLGHEIFSGQMLEKKTISTSSFLPGTYLLILNDGYHIDGVKFIKL